MKWRNQRILNKMSLRLEKIYKYSFWLRLVFLRKGFVVDQLKLKKETSGNKPMCSQERKTLADFWGAVPIDEGWFQFYNWVNRGQEASFDSRYIPLDMEYCIIDDWFNDTESALMLDDKNFYDLYFPDVLQPRTVVRILDGHMLDANYVPIEMEQAIKLCRESESVLLKPAVLSNCGRGLIFWRVDDGEERLRNILSVDGSYVIQQVVRQHPNIAKLHPHSVNTIRLVTCYLDNEMKVLSSVIRIGANGSVCDNASQGGYFCGIEDDGRLKKYGYTKNGVAVEMHPQGAVFSECVIPNFDNCKTLVCRLAYRFIRTSKLISWDLAIEESGLPILIEVNLCYGGIDIHQIANGPIFGDKTKYIIGEVFKNKKYRLVNRLLR